MNPRSGEEFQRQVMQFIRESYQIPAEITDHPAGGYVFVLRLPDPSEQSFRAESRKGVSIKALKFLADVEREKLDALQGVFAIMMRRKERGECEKHIRKIEELLRGAEHL